ncbi:SGNH/GDSL hydrolase family protein [Myxococcaceae bacterium GXIMD 01537]
MRGWLALWGWASCVLLVGCGTPSGPTRPEEAAPVQAQESPAPAPPPGGLEAEPALVLEGGDAARPTPPPPPFLPAFHQALRWSRDAGSLTTFRFFVPVGREGDALRVTFRAGDGDLTVQRASIAKAGPQGTLASAPVPLTFSGGPGFTVGKRTRATSDAVPFTVRRGEELAVTFEARGALAASAINAFPGSTARPGALALSTGALGGEPYQVLVGLDTIEVRGAPSRVFIAIGDSITEGYYDDFNDYRKVWTALVEAQLGVPVLSAGVSGQGFYGELMNVDQEVLAVRGITDCILLLGTNDLGSGDVGELQGRMSALLNRLEPFCRTWVSTLLPKEKTNHGDYAMVKSERLAMNAWIRQLPRATVIDLEAATCQPGNVHLYRDGLEVDGIHPSPAGHQVMADEVVRMVRENWKR